MDWDGALAAAKEWVAKSSLGFSVNAVVEEDRKISFQAPCGSFYVTVPEKIGSEEWVPWICCKIVHLTSPQYRRCVHRLNS